MNSARIAGIFVKDPVKLLLTIAALTLTPAALFLAINRYDSAATESFAH